MFHSISSFEIQKSLAHGELPIILEANDNTTFNQDNKITGVVLGLRTEDIYETVKFLKDKEVEFIVDEPTNCPPGKYISFRDPFGNIFRVSPI